MNINISIICTIISYIFTYERLVHTFDKLKLELTILLINEHTPYWHSAFMRLHTSTRTHTRLDYLGTCASYPGTCASSILGPRDDNSELLRYIHVHCDDQ